MHRRQLISLIGAAAAWPLAARGQQPTLPVVGLLTVIPPSEYTQPLRAFRQGLAEAGYLEGRNVAVEYHWAEEQSDRLPELAADLARRKVSLIVADGRAPALVAKAATSTVPVVFSVAIDPVAEGLVASMNRPGGNITGFTSLNATMMPKRLEILHELSPSATVIVQLLGPRSDGLADVQAAAHKLGLQLHVVNAGTERELDAVLATVDRLHASGLAIGPSPSFSSWSDRLAALAAHKAVPAISPYRAFATAGGLISYGDDIIDQMRQAALYAARILRGEKPGDLPVQQAAKIKLTLNLRAARALGLPVPITLLGRADEVIE